MPRFFDRRLLRQASSERLLLALTVGLGALAGLATVGQAAALSRAVAGAFLGGLDLAGVWPALQALIAFTALRAAAVWTAEVTASQTATRIKTALRERLLAHILALGPAYTRGERAGELVNTASEGIEALDAYFGQYLPQVALAALVPLIFLALVFPVDPLSGLVLLLTAPLIPVFMILIGGLADALTRRQWAELSRMSAHFLDVLQGLTTLKLFNRSREQVAVIRQITDRHRDATLQVLRVAFLSALVLEMVGTLSTAIVAVEIGLRLLYGLLAFEQAFFVLILAPEFYLPLRLLGTRFHAGIAGVMAARRIFEVLETGSERVGAGDRERGAGCRTESFITESPASRFRVCFENVSYTYPDRERPALDGVSLEIGPGEKVALVGPTGAGKSTIAHLLLGFIQPTSGVLTFDGRPSDAFTAPLRPTIAWVPQLPHLFDASVADNIRLGRPDATLDEVIAAARAAHADAFIRDLPQGYATRLGERGNRLSAGQAQRIALARAFLLAAPLVILDEPTAHLDPQTEADVQAAVERLLRGRSALIIAHRLHTIRAADRIVMLEAGRVIETGTHEELLGRRGAYWRLLMAASGEIEDHAGEDRESWPRAQHELDQQVRSASPAITDRPAHLTSEVSRATLRFFRLTSPIVRLFSFLRPFWPRIALAVLLGFLTIASSIGLLATSAWIIAMAALQPSVAVLQVAIVGVRFFGIARGLARYGERLVSHQVTFRVLAQIRTWFYAAIEPLAPARLAGQHSGDLLSRIVADTASLEHFFVRAVAPPLVALLVLALIAVILGSYHLSLVWPALGFLLLTGVVAPVAILLAARAPGRRLAEQRAGLNALFVDGVQGTADVVAFGAGDRMVAAAWRLSAALGRTQVRLAGLSGLSTAFSLSCTWLAVVAVLVVAIPLVTAGRLDGVSLAVLALATSASFEAVSPLPLAAQHLASSLAAARRLFALTDGGGESAQTGRPATGQKMQGAEADQVEGRSVRENWQTHSALAFEGVTLRYAADEPPALADVTFAVPVGSTVAVVGPSGAGKSSLINALLCFWDHEAGQIRLFGRNVRDLDETDVRAQVGVVAHDPHLFTLTVADNIRLARPAATQGEVEAAARVAGAHDFVVRLPRGYDTWLGEGGTKLSGGERQKIALARVVLKDAPLLILDEPTAHLDAEAERQVSEALMRAMHGRTTLLVTHRLQLARSADRVVVLVGGRVVDVGRHEELLARCAVYRMLSGV